MSTVSHTLKSTRVGYLPELLELRGEHEYTHFPQKETEARELK